MGRFLAVLVLASLSYVFATDVPATAQDIADADIEAIHEQYLDDPELQLEWPNPEPEEITRSSTPGWLRWIGEAIGIVLRFLGPLFEVLFWVAIGLGVGAIAHFLLRGMLASRFGWGERSKTPKIEESVAEPFRPDAAVARSLLEDADALAAAGRYAEAVHLLLFRSIDDIRERREGGVPASLTSREITSLNALPDRARKLLSPIVDIVERSFFGGRPVDADGWQTARATYQDFAFGDGWS